MAGSPDRNTPAFRTRKARGGLDPQALAPRGVEEKPTWGRKQTGGRRSLLLGGAGDEPFRGRPWSMQETDRSPLDRECSHPPRRCSEVLERPVAIGRLAREQHRLGRAIERHLEGLERRQQS